MTNNLGTADYTIGGDYDTWGDKFVADMAILSKVAGDVLVLSSSSGTVTLTTEQMQNFAYQANGGTSSQVDFRLPDGISRYGYWKNDRATGAITVRCAAGGTSVTLNPGDRRFVYSDGVNCVDLTLVTVSIASVAGLQAALDAKLALAGGTLTGALVLAGDPAASLQAATKQYVDTLAANVGKRTRTRVMDTSDSDPATSGYAAGTTIDGVVLAAGDMIIRNAAGHAARNGVWIAPATGAAARSSEYDTFNEHTGSLISVAEGTVGADTLWLCTSNDGGTLNTTSITYSQAKLVAAGSETVSGILRLATLAEVKTETDNTLAVSPANLTPFGRLDTEGQTVSGGARTTVKDLGALSAAGSNTITPDPGGRPKQKITNDHAGSILPGSNNGDYLLEVINASGAGAVTTTGWTLKGDSFDTTSTSKFLCSCHVSGDQKVMIVTKTA